MAEFWEMFFVGDFDEVTIWWNQSRSMASNGHTPHFSAAMGAGSSQEDEGEDEDKMYIWCPN